MLRTIDYVQLDPDTKAYLREVRRANGRGAPGVFEAKTDARAALALLAGLIVLPLFLWLGYSTNKAPWAAALIQTAGVVLGGWLVVYAVRRWTANVDKYAGRFVYFDPEHVFVGGGEEVRYARLDDATRAEPAGDTGVEFSTGGGDFVVPVTGRAVAQFVSDYYDALAHLRRNRDGWWDGQPPATLGAIARYMVVNERVPVNLSEVSLEIDSMPEEVRPARRRPSGVLRYLLILVVGAGVYFAFLSTNQPLHDAGAFAAVNQSSPGDLRHYLADPHTAAHHEEAKAKLAALYDKPIADVRTNGTDPQTADAFARLLDTLRGPETPAVSLAVGSPDPTTSADWLNKLRERLADGIGDAVGKEYIVFVRKPDDKPALLDLTYTTAGGELVWTLEFRLKPDDGSPYFTTRNTIPQTTTSTSEAVYADVMKRMTGKTPAAPPPPPAGGDW